MELTEWDIEQIERLINGNSNAGYIVKTKKGLVGRTFHSKGLINGKMPVYIGTGPALLCDLNSLTLTGFID